jgi:peptide/nickel transport system substrate-binding protein
MVLIEDQEVIQLRAIAGEIDFQHRHIQMSKLPVFMENADKNNYNVAFWPPAHGAQAGIKFNLSYGFGDPLDYDPDPEIMKWNNDKDFRIAISHAINRSDIREALFQGVGTLTQVSYVKGHAFYPGDEWANKYTEYDPAKSNELLDGVGLTKKDSDGFRLRSDGKGTLSFVATWRDISDHGKFAEMIQSDLAEVGIKVILNLEDAKTYGSRRGRNIQEWHITHVGGARFPEVMTEWHTHGPAFRNWYTGGVDTYAIGNPGAEPTDPNILRIVDLTNQAKKLRYPDRAEVYKEVQRIMIDNMFHIGLVSANPASNGVIIKKNNFLNVPPKAPNDAYLQNPGVGRAIQFFFVDGKNDSE